MLDNIRKNIMEITSVLTVGFPFVGYKFLAGIILLNGVKGFSGFTLFWFFMIFAIIDLFLNLRALYLYIIRGYFSGSVCLLSFLSRKSRRLSNLNEAGEAFDTMISFGIVALVVGVELFSYMGGFKFLWNISTVVNVLGAGLSRLMFTFSYSEK